MDGSVPQLSIPSFFDHNCNILYSGLRGTMAEPLDLGAGSRRSPSATSGEVVSAKRAPSRNLDQVCHELVRLRCLINVAVQPKGKVASYFVVVLRLKDGPHFRNCTKGCFEGIPSGIGHTAYSQEGHLELKLASVCGPVEKPVESAEIARDRFEIGRRLVFGGHNGP